MNKTMPLLLLSLCASIAQAQEPADTIAIDPVVVTATRIPLPVSRVTAAVTIIDDAELRRRGVRTVAEALRLVSGAAVVQSGSYGASTSLFLRGGESDYVQVLIDGVQVNSPGEQFNFSSLAIEDIDRIEIVKGPASVLYGSDAMSGVIQLFTKQAAGPTRAQVSLSGGRGDQVGDQADGAFNNGYASAELNGGNEARRYSIGVSHFATRGAYAFNNQHRNTSLTARGSVRPAARSDLSGTLRLTASRYHIPTDGTGQLNDRNQFQDANALALGLGGVHRFSDRLQAQLDLQHTQNDATTDDRPDDAGDTLGFFRFRADERFSRQNADLRLHYRLGESSTFTLGSQLDWQSNRASSESPFGNAPENTEKRNNQAIYTQWLAEYSRFSLQLGARAEDNDRFGSFATYRGGVSVAVTPALRVRASAGTALKQPRFFEQFAQGFVRGNPDLEPERSRSIEAGADLTWGKARFTASFFDQQFQDLIQYVGVPAAPTDPNYFNVAGARASGLELDGTLAFAHLVLKGSYTLLDTRVSDEGDGQDPSFIEGEELLRRPRHSGSVVATVPFSNGHVTASANYVGRRADLDFASFPADRVTLPAHTRIDVSGEYRLSSALAGTLKIENLLDTAYEEVLGFPALRRVVYLGARVSLP